MDNKSTYFCTDCAFKHMSQAKVLWHEIHNGYNRVDHIGFFIGNLGNAADHLLELKPEISEEIRAIRKLCWDNLLAGEVVWPDFDAVLMMIWALATEADAAAVVDAFEMSEMMEASLDGKEETGGTSPD